MVKILLIEDNLSLRESTSELLKLANYNVSTAENGIIGVEKVKDFEPDIIICDIMMPELDGYGVLYLLSKNTKTASIPFIFMSAKSDKNDVRMGMKMGADDYLTKPFEDVELFDAIESRLKKKNLLEKVYTNNFKENTFVSEDSSFEELENLCKDNKQINYQKKGHLYIEGDLAYKLYFIKSGKVKTCKMADSGKEFITGIFGSGDFLGAMSLLGKSRVYNESAIIMEDAKICSISKDVFTTLIFSNKMVSNAFIKLLSDNLVEREQQLTRLAYDSVRQRIAKILLDLSFKENLKKKVPSKINIIREDLAGLIGSASETTVRALSKLKEDGLISINGRIINVIDKNELTRVANSGYL